MPSRPVSTASATSGGDRAQQQQRPPLPNQPNSASSQQQQLPQHPSPPPLGNLDLPINPHSLFKVTLNSDELFNYLRRLGDEVRAQTQYSASVVAEMNKMRGEMEVLKGQTRTQLEDFTTKVKTMENGLSATVSEAQFRTTINYCQRQIGNVAQMLDMNDEELKEGAGMPGLAATGGGDNYFSEEGATMMPHAHARGATTTTNGGSSLSNSGSSISVLNNNNNNNIASGGGSAMSSSATTNHHHHPSPSSQQYNSSHRGGAAGSIRGGGKNDNNSILGTTSMSVGGKQQQQGVGGNRPPSPTTTVRSEGSASKIGKKVRTPREDGAEGGIRGLIAKEINEWYRTRGQVDAKIRHDVTIATSKAQMQELQTALEENIKEAVSELVALPYLKETLETQQASSQKSMGIISKEQDRIRKTQAQFQARIRSSVTATIKRVSGVSMSCSKRISRFYAMMSLPEPVVPEGEEEEEEYGSAAEYQYWDEDDVEGTTEGGGGGGSSQAAWSSDLESPRSSVQQQEGGEDAGSLTDGVGTTHNNNSKQSRRRRVTEGVGAGGAYFPMDDALPFPPPADVGRKAPKGAMSTGKPRTGTSSSKPTTSRLHVGGERPRATTADSDATIISEGGMDATTSTVIHSPVFVAFRQHVLNDISERIASARSTQSSDIDVELLALRNDIRHRVTSSRVVELIKQYSDTETPHRVTQLFRITKELEGDKVSVLDLNDGLRSKADAHILDTKANIEYVDGIARKLTQRLDSLQADLSILIADRKEYREVVQQLLLQTQHYRNRGAGGGTAAGGTTSGMFPGISGVDGEGGDALGGGAGTVLMAAGGGVMSPPTTRTFTGGNKSHPGGLVPLTELLHARHVGGPMVGSVVHTPSPPLPLLHRPDPSSEGSTAVGPITQSQQEYAFAIASAASEEQQHPQRRNTVTVTSTIKSPQPPPFAGGGGDRSLPSATTKSAPFAAGGGGGGVSGSPSSTYPISRQHAESAAPIPFLPSSTTPSK